MIILSGVLVVLAIALLVTGIVTGNTGHEVAGLDGLKLIYVSIGISIISALCLAIGVFLRRKELFGSATAETSAKKSAARSKTARTAKAKARVGAGEEAPVAVAPTTAVDVPAETSVYVVPGRKRYHLETCRQLAGRDKEELTYVEAREEGFTACTACLPDTALAARAAVTEAESTAETLAPADDTRTTESLETVAETAELTRPRDDDPAPVTRTDLPVTRLDDDETAPAAESPAEAEFTETPEADALHETDAKAQPEVDETPAEAGRRTTAGAQPVVLRAAGPGRRHDHRRDAGRRRRGPHRGARRARGHRRRVRGRRADPDAVGGRRGAGGGGGLRDDGTAVRDGGRAGRPRPPSTRIRPRPTWPRPAAPTRPTRPRPTSPPKKPPRRTTPRPTTRTSPSSHRGRRVRRRRCRRGHRRVIGRPARPHSERHQALPPPHLRPHRGHRGRRRRP